MGSFFGQDHRQSTGTAPCEFAAISTRPDSDSNSTVIDLDDIIARCMGNLDFVQRILVKFHQQAGKDLDELAAGLESADARHIAQVAHRLKGASASVAATRLREVVATIEQLGRSENLSEVPDHLEQLRAEWELLGGYLAELLSSADSFSSAMLSDPARASPPENYRACPNR